MAYRQFLLILLSVLWLSGPSRSDPTSDFGNVSPGGPYDLSYMSAPQNNNPDPQQVSPQGQAGNARGLNGGQGLQISQFPPGLQLSNYNVPPFNGMSRYQDFTPMQQQASFPWANRNPNIVYFVPLPGYASQQVPVSAPSASFDVNDVMSTVAPVTEMITTATPFDIASSPVDIPSSQTPSQSQAAGPGPMLSFGVGPGGPFDLSYLNDLSQNLSPSRKQMLQPAQGPNSIVVSVPQGPRVEIRPAFDLYPYALQYDHSPYHRLPPTTVPMTPQQLANSATGTVVNTGGAQRGSLSATGTSNTQTGSMGALSAGTGTLTGSGTGLTGTSVNTAGANTGSSPLGGLDPSLFPNGVLPPGTGSANSMFLNNFAAQQGKFTGGSNTLSKTGPDGSAMGLSSGTAQGSGKNLQLNQVANSQSSGSGAASPSFPYSPHGQYGSRFKRQVPGSWAALFGLGHGVPVLPYPPMVIMDNANGTDGSLSGRFVTITDYNPQTGVITQSGGGSAVFLAPSGPLSPAAIMAGTGSSSSSLSNNVQPIPSVTYSPENKL